MISTRAGPPRSGPTVQRARSSANTRGSTRAAVAVSASEVSAPPSDWRNHPLFNGLSDDQLALLQAHFREVRHDEGELVIEEGDSTDDVFIIHGGSVEVTKRVPGSAALQQLAVLHAGECFGEVGLIDRKPRSASVWTLEPTRLSALSVDQVKSLSTGSQSLHSVLIRNLAAEMARRLRGTNEIAAASLEREVEHLKARVAMGTFIAYVVLVMSIYGFILRAATTVAQTASSATFVTIPVVLGLAAVLFVMMLQSGYPLRTYGLTLENWKTNCVESVLWTLPFLALLTLGKLVLIKTLPQFSHLSLFNIYAAVNPDVAARNGYFVALIGLAYLSVVPLQELSIRGALQSSLQVFFVGRRSTLWAIVISNALFTCAHLHLSETLAVLVFPAGVFWGILFARQRSLLGPIVSHMLVGWWALFLLDLGAML